MLSRAPGFFVLAGAAVAAFVLLQFASAFLLSIQLQGLGTIAWLASYGVGGGLVLMALQSLRGANRP